MPVEVRSCALCGDDRHQPVKDMAETGEECSFVICAGCAFVFMSPRMTEAEATEFYGDGFWSRKATTSRRAWLAERLLPLSLRMLLQSNTYRELASKQERIFDRVNTDVLARISLPPDALIVDVGCSWGVLAKEISRVHGYRTCGVEPSELAVRYARSIGVDIVSRRAETMASDSSLKGEVDLLIFHTSILNINDLRQGLDQMDAMIKPDGFIYIRTRNFYWVNRLAKFNNYAFVPENLEHLFVSRGYRTVWKRHEGLPSQTEIPGDDFRFMSFIFQRSGAPLRSPFSLSSEGVLEESRIGAAKTAAAG